VILELIRPATGEVAIGERASLNPEDVGEPLRTLEDAAAAIRQT
jgi:hypothetical protein